MEKEQPKWKPIKKGEKLPCWAYLMTMDGTITRNVSAMGVTIGQDAYYLPSEDLIETIKDFPKEESEDERIRKALIGGLKDCIYTEWYDGVSIKEIIAWLEKQGEQKPTEWSEEDEKEIAILKAYIRSGEWSEAHIDRALGIVDSLRPQNRWKPSEEQIYELSKVVYYYTSHGYPNKIINELLEQLKNL
jgi:hypothetical protein